MDLRNCSKCGRVFAFKGSDICSRCATDDEGDFKKVKDYLYDHPGASVKEVSEETEVTEKQILRYLRENRIEIREESNFFLDCERCGKPIRSGRFCEICTVELKKEFQSVMKPRSVEKKVESGLKTKMHIAEMRKKNK
ncbi:TIGR03826 family flagellar region protein [Alkaliphilus peptidifermentans]|uniref:Flagellar operon protein TIGR03826 n=1 Tax=Alkaliphilus peptidifermentans DSM 18978 TaxID=1120976 RepID=A0A1G5JGM5_9FIRM|nr:TIGR03826 family flagellar region protein [Alkaliphilus peptidifermentans]SCY86939.1 flagellar operon protein TIGR03826 [Alkaliphilus peptidifermentans DSM 18978]